MATLDNLNKELSKLQFVTNFCEFYDYVKIDTNFVINYLDEYLVLYAKVIDDEILITDLSSIFEHIYLNGVSVNTLSENVKKYGLNFDGKCVFAKSSISRLNNNIQSFLNLMKELNL